MHQGHSLEYFGDRLREFLNARTAWLNRQLHAAPAEPLPQFNAWALELFSLQFRQNSAYRRFCETRGITPAGIGQWRHIPALPTAAFKELELTCIPEAQRTSVFYSSGTTAHQPSRHFHHAGSLEVYEASLLAWFIEQFATPAGQLTGRDTSPALPELYGQDALALTPDSAQARHSSLVHMFETLRRRLHFNSFIFTGLVTEDGSWRLDAPRTVALLEQASSANRPILLLGTAFSCMHLLDHLQEHDLALRLPAGSRVLETGGYKGRSRVLPKSELHALITARLGIAPSNIICEYGMSELSSQAYGQLSVAERIPAFSQVQDQAAPERWFQFPPWARVRIISPETGNEVGEGQTGLVRILDLANVYSVLAVQTEDLGIRRGDGFELVGRAVLAEPRGCSLMAP